MEKSKVSFSLSAPKSSGKPSAAGVLSSGDEDDDQRVESVAGPQYITVFDPSEPPPAKAPVVIPPIPNSLFPSLLSDGVADFVLDTSDSAATVLPYGLTVRSSAAPPVETRAATQSDGGGGDEDPALRRLREDLKRLPEHRGMVEFEEVGVGEFGAAVLRGYGWREGQALGRNKEAPDPGVPVFKALKGTPGIGYVPPAAASSSSGGEEV